MTQQERKEVEERTTRTTQRLIRVVIEEMTDPSKGRLTTRGVILSLQEAIDYLENSALMTSPENYLEKAES